MDEFTTHDLIEELSNRYENLAVLTLREGKLKNIERYNQIVHGGPTTVLGMLRRAEFSVVNDLNSPGDDVDIDDD